jgi:hypothetical protein
MMALTIHAGSAWAAPVGAVPCASAESVARATHALAPYLSAQPVGMVLLDCRVQTSQRLRCTASQQSQSGGELATAALAYANELDVCPGTPRHLMFPLVLRGDAGATRSPSP